MAALVGVLVGVCVAAGLAALLGGLRRPPAPPPPQPSVATILESVPCGRPAARDIVVFVVDGRSYELALDGCGNTQGLRLDVELVIRPDGSPSVRLAGSGDEPSGVLVQRLSVLLLVLAGLSGALLVVRAWPRRFAWPQPRPRRAVAPDEPAADSSEDPAAVSHSPAAVPAATAVAFASPAVTTAGPAVRELDAVREVDATGVCAAHNPTAVEFTAPAPGVGAPAGAGDSGDGGWFTDNRPQPAAQARTGAAAMWSSRSARPAGAPAWPGGQPVSRPNGGSAGEPAWPQHEQHEQHDADNGPARPQPVAWAPTRTPTAPPPSWPAQSRP